MHLEDTFPRIADFGPRDAPPKGLEEAPHEVGVGNQQVPLDLRVIQGCQRPRLSALGFVACQWPLE